MVGPSKRDTAMRKSIICHQMAHASVKPIGETVTLFKSFSRDQSGVSSIEYAVLAAVTALVFSTAMSQLETSLTSQMVVEDGTMDIDTLTAGLGASSGSESGGSSSTGTSSGETGSSNGSDQDSGSGDSDSGSSGNGNSGNNGNGNSGNNGNHYGHGYGNGYGNGYRH